MESVLIAVLLATTPANLPTSVDPVAFDRRCFALMSEIAEDEDPRLRALGRVAAPYFLGRIDATDPGLDVEAGGEADVPQDDDRDGLVLACGDAMLSGGYDPQEIGDALAPPELPAA